MKPILGICVVFVFVGNSAVLCFSNEFTEYIKNALNDAQKAKDAAIKNVTDIFTTNKLTIIGRSNFTEIVKMFGHKCEEHEVTTEDDYLLKLYHIPGNVKKTVLLIHGNTENAYGFIHRGKNSLSITLADKGWDVWVINLRGTTESRRHKYLDPVRDSSKFFNYTFYENGLYDVPPTIDYVLKKTSQDQLTVITHSQGSSDMYVLGSERPEYNDKVKLNVNLAPVATFIKMRGSIAILTNGAYLLGKYSTTPTDGEETMSHHVMAPLYQGYCLNPFTINSCLESYFVSCGRDVLGMEPEFLYTYYGHYPAGTSTKLLNHITQIMIKNKFRKYDYGKERNLQVYHSEEPPEIDLSKVTMRTALFTGKNDYFCSIENSNTIAAALPNVVQNVILPYEYFNHLDYIDGRFMADNFYPHLFKVLDKYT